jgi:hypothetical protein
VSVVSSQLNADADAAPDAGLVAELLAFRELEVEVNAVLQ